MNITARQIIDLSTRIEWQAFVAANPEPCPQCEEAIQIQLRDAFDQGGAIWRCRKCNHKWHYTPTP